MTTTASATEMGLLFLVVGVLLGAVPLGAGILALARPTRAHHVAALLVTGITGTVGFAMGTWGALVRILGGILVISALVWASILVRPRRGLAVAATILPALPLLYMIAVVLTWM